MTIERKMKMAKKEQDWKKVRQNELEKDDLREGCRLSEVKVSNPKSNILKFKESLENISMPRTVGAQGGGGQKSEHSCSYTDD